MTAALILPVSGAYTASWGAGALGLMDDNGYELSAQFHAQEINRTDAYQMTLLDAIHQGMDWRVRMAGQEWKAGLLNILQMFGAVSGGVLSPALQNIIPIGGRYSLAAGALILVSILGSPPTAPATLTALLASLTPNSQSTFNMTSKVRVLPLELSLLPYNASGTAVPFTVT